MKYRLMFARTGEPDSDWSDDAEHFHRYIAERPEGISKLIVVDEEGNEVKPATAEDELETVAFERDPNPEPELMEVYGIDRTGVILIPATDEYKKELFEKFEAAAEATDTEEEIEDGLMTAAELPQMLIDRAEQKSAEDDTPAEWKLSTAELKMVKTLGVSDGWSLKEEDGGSIIKRKVAASAAAADKTEQTDGN